MPSAPRPPLRLVDPALAARPEVSHPEPPGDDALMALAQAGDTRAFGVLVTRHEQAVRRFAGLLVGDSERGRELAQDAFVRAWEARGRYLPSGRLRGWLYGFVRKLAAHERRRARVRRLFGLGPPPAWTAPAELEPAPFEALAARDRDRIVGAALGRVPPKMREALVLRFVEGLDYDAMAAVLGTSASTLRSRVHHGLAHLAVHVPEEILR